jgi:predicted ATPase
VRVAETVVAAVRRLSIPHQGSSLGHVTVSLGCAGVVPRADGTPQQLLEDADNQLYRAKEGGRNRVASAGGVSAAPRADRNVVIKHNLPAARTSFVARSAELAELERLLSSGRLVTVVGAGGVGKTRLARELGLRSAARYADGTWFVDLTSVTAGEDSIAQAIASAIAPLMTSGVTAALLNQLLRNKAALLILDNAEHLTDEVARIADRMLDAAPGVRLLVTSREPLDIDGEFVHRLPFLNDEDGAQLFIERARAAGMDAQLVATQADAIARIAEQLEGLPLAIEMAATKAATTEPRELLVHLNDRLAILQSRSRSSPARHRTLQAMLDWSYDLLDEQTRAAFLRLGVFAGGWTVEAARAICFDEAPSCDDCIALLDGLVAKSLVVRDDAARYRFLESTREYALEKLDGVGALDTLQLLHADYFSRYAADGVACANETFASIELRDRPELPNYRAALTTLLDFRSEPERAAALFWQLRIVIPEFIVQFRQFGDALGWLLAVDVSGVPRARLATALSELYQFAQPHRSIELALEARELFAAAGDDYGWAHATQQLHASYFLVNGVAGQIPLAEMQSAFAIAQREGDRRLAALLMFKIGIDLAHDELMGESIASFERAAHIADPEDRTSLGLIVGNIGVARMRLHDYERAIVSFERALSILEERRPWRAPLLYVNLAYLNYFRQDFEAARDAISRALELERTYPSRMACGLIFDTAALVASKTAGALATLRLAGFAQNCFEGGTRQAFDQELFDAMLAELRGATSADEYEAAWNQGMTMTFEEAARLALAPWE